jgi:hypothetical protein
VVMVEVMRVPTTIGPVGDSRRDSWLFSMDGEGS